MGLPARVNGLCSASVIDWLDEGDRAEVRRSPTQSSRSPVQSTCPLRPRRPRALPHAVVIADRFYPAKRFALSFAARPASTAQGSAASVCEDGALCFINQCGRVADEDRMAA